MNIQEKVKRIVNRLPDDEVFEDAEADDDEGQDFEYRVATIEPIATERLSVKAGGVENADVWLEAMLNDGWQIDCSIPCPPLITYVLYREKGEE